MTRRPPRLLVRMMVVTFVTAPCLVAVVFGVVVRVSRDQVRDTVRAELESSQRMIGALQDREQHGLWLQAGSVVESPTLKAAVDTYAAESRTADASVRTQLHNTIAGELRTMAARVEADAIVVVDARQRTLAAAGRLGSLWPNDTVVPMVGDTADTASNGGVIRTQAGLFRVVTAPLVLGDGSDIGGGASIMGTLSGGGTQQVRLGENCLLGANSGIGVALGDNCIVEAGCYITAGSKVKLPDGEVVAARALSGHSNILFRRNSQSGALEVVPNKAKWEGLNSALHKN